MAALKHIELQLEGTRDLALIGNTDSVWLVVPLRWWDLSTLFWWLFVPMDKKARVTLDHRGRDEGADACGSRGDEACSGEGVWMTTLSPSQNAFHDHLDACAQCRNNPFGLCDAGAHILEEEVNKIGEGMRSGVWSRTPKRSIVDASLPA